MDLLAAKPHPDVADLIGAVEAQPVAEEPHHRRKLAHVERDMLAALGTDTGGSGRRRGILIGGHSVEELEAMAAGPLDQRAGGDTRLLHRSDASAPGTFSLRDG